MARKADKASKKAEKAKAAKGEAVAKPKKSKKVKVEVAEILPAFVTRLYTARLAGADALNEDLARTAYSIAGDDEAGQAWSAEHGYGGYTSYASLNDLPWRAQVFDDLAKRLDGHVSAFAEALELELNGRALVLDSLWINILGAGGVHTGHIHPHSVISGTYYVVVPKGASRLKLEDPRLPLMMAAPPRRHGAAPEHQTFRYLTPEAGMVALWESWLRHEVTPNGADEDRVSVSFNYRWG